MLGDVADHHDAELVLFVALRDDEEVGLLLPHQTDRLGDRGDALDDRQHIANRPADDVEHIDQERPQITIP